MNFFTGMILVASLPLAGFAKDMLAPTPPMGWNSYDSYGTYCHEQACFDNLKTFVEVFKPLGYEYFVVDGGWYIEYDTVPGTLLPTSDKGREVNMDEYGRFIPSKCYFPNGFKSIADECHKHGVKFGVHILRGIPRKAVELSTPVLGTNVRAGDIADTTSTCTWNQHIYGVDMNKPGAQAYYDSWIQSLADQGIDFIKADDIVTYPAEIAAVRKAIDKCGRPITLSLSPGGRVLGDEIRLYETADLLRVTGDVWDRQADIDKCFDAWLTWQYVPVRQGFWLDMDMIPFGELQVMVPEGTKKKMAGIGTHRFDQFTVSQKESFITMRAMSASPLMIGGVLPTLDEESIRLLTNKEMIACNQNGVMGHLVNNSNYVQIWKTPERDAKKDGGWIAIFNRCDEPRTAFIGPKQMGLDAGKKYVLRDVWGRKVFKPGKVTVEPNACVFVRYE
ncbi:glycoside hydrolase family 27 protein [Pontiella sulfatireligans]|uniref:Alpha-galactosidase n=1 Tax=Pontiella sulfatireligans TaxID=2750658 RepID=A0A6C2UPC2_9BACT|nr:glycoside hydrolase family 27 protein [Pontiella sulfatireligans]VGO20866.1 Alpha-galactosidase A [Pontiella sulfatireligans]